MSHSRIRRAVVPAVVAAGLAAGTALPGAPAASPSGAEAHAVWVFSVGLRTGDGPDGIVVVCSARRRTVVSGVVAGLRPRTAYRLVIAGSRRALRAGRGRRLARPVTDAAGVVVIVPRVALRRALPASATVLGLVADDEEASELEEAAESGVEEPLTGSQPSDPDADPCER